jgi:hypothetical protein
MPSDERLSLVLDAVQSSRAAFGAALAASAEQVREFLRVQQSSSDNGRASRLASELGSFAAGRIDPARLATLFQAATTCDPGSLAAVEQALDTLTALADRQAEAEVLEVPAGGDLHAAVALALAGIGSAFRAVRTFELARAGSRRSEAPGGTPEPLPYAGWSRGERRAAPPLVVTLDGAELRAGCLEPYLDGGQKILLVVRGACAPAPLVRCITPGAFVLQTADAAGLDRFIAWAGPGIAALVPETAARFTHDPAAGAGVWERLTIAFVPEREPRVSVGGISAAQQIEELRQLRMLAVRPAAPAAVAVAPSGGAEAAAGADPAGQLAAWLMAQADLGDLG